MFIHDDFLLHSETARRLYHGYAATLPIIDYHCHIDPQEIAEDRCFENISQVWLGGDHYKWRLIRSNGVPEAEVTGDAPDRVKFQRFAQMLPRAIGNPMYHWTHLELKRYFGYDGLLNDETAEEVWQLCNQKLREPEFSAQGLIRRSNVELIGTTDDPVDDLRWHRKITADGQCTARVCPSFRPDKAVNIDKPGFLEYLKRLEEAAGVPIHSVSDVKAALSARLAFFAANGCRSADHGLDYPVFAPATDEEVERIFRGVMEGKPVSPSDAAKYKTALLLHLGREYAKDGIVMQIHYGVQRNVNSAVFGTIGPDAGCDCIRTGNASEAVTGLLNALEQDKQLPKTILYSLDPSDNEMLDSVIGCFQSGTVPGKIQHGSAWWFSDTRSGMEAQLRSLANLGILGNFVGMLTDSRSFLSYTRHEYFRRILCDLLGTWVEQGAYPADEKQLGALVQDICYYNARRYFGLDGNEGETVTAERQ